MITDHVKSYTYLPVGNTKFTRANPQKECGTNSHHKWVTPNLALALIVFSLSLSLSLSQKQQLT